MATEAERSVIIALKLVPDPKNQATASLVSSQALSVSKAGEGAYEKLLTIAGQSQKQISEIQKIQAGNRNEIDQLEQSERIKLMEEAVSHLARIDENLTKKAEIESEKREKQRLSDHDKQIKEAQELAERIQEAEQTRIESYQKAGESAIGAVQGLADMVEGAAKLGLVSEENAEKFAKKFSLIKDGISVFKGFSDVIWKGREALIALSTASKAQTMANELMAASQAKVATTSTVARVAGASSVGTTTLAAGGGAAATGGTAAGGGSVVAGTVVLAKITAVMTLLVAAGLALHEGFTFLLRSFGLVTDSTESATGALWGMWEAQENLAKSEEKLAKAEKARQRLLDARTRFEEEEAQKSQFETDLRNAQTDVDDVKRIVEGGGNQSELERDRQKALKEIRVAELAILEDRRVQEERIAAGHFMSVKNRERVMKSLEEAQGRLLDLEKNRLKVITDQKKQIAEQLKSEQEKLQVAKDALKSEEQRLLERFGRLSRVQRHRVEAVAGKRAAGQRLTKQDIKDLEDAGLAGDIASQFFVQRGIQAGGISRIKELGLLTQRQSAVDKFGVAQEKEQRKLARLSSPEDQIRAALLATAERRQQIVNARVKESIDLTNVRSEDVKGFQQDQKLFINAVQQVTADGNDNITQQSMEVVKALGTNLRAMTEGLEDMKKEIQENRFKKDLYK
ncbi:coiled-coil domain-containing protein [Gimesia aquarii]|uniref:Uncharacterized protein n=1 Tax=Gimesia aquarii TaxID=2527964 RepID=A0A517VP09_9PLAN|nr:hypothetical protein [Gimesia aquarii]QDT94752.1 hypothetical protein V144x_01830 [Gimesia aquarii]